MKNTAPQKLDDTQIENEEKKDEANNNEEESNDQSTFKSKFSGFQFNLNLNLSQAQKALKVDEPSEGKVNESKNDNNKPFAASELIQNDQQMNKREQKDMSKPKSNLDVVSLEFYSLVYIVVENGWSKSKLQKEFEIRR